MHHRFPGFCVARADRPLKRWWCVGWPRTMPGPHGTRTRILLWLRVRTDAVLWLSPRWN